MNSTTQKLSFTVPLSFEAHSIAQELVSEIYNQEKRQQVYLNSLTVYAVNNYLRCMGFETDYSEGDSRNFLAVELMNVADLIVKDIGKLECLPVLAEAEVVEISPEVWEDRIGYVFVELSDSLKSAKILGFTPEAADKIYLSKLESLSDFLVYLTELEVVESVQAETTSNIINFRKWLDGVVDASWQKLDELLKPQQLGLAFKNEVSITRGQKIDLGMHLDKISVALVMKVMSESESEGVDILTQLYPVGEMALPEGIKLIIRDETGEALEVVSREEDNWIQSEFSAESGEKFNITVAYGDSEVMKQFEV
ncbi:DUF1822 family protein [Calothrix sp. CCY 0018]|uniref:DUF1822 family protein n=1 Tax=Calothrix sp. CCY 0018 TaxID=3103864 RepID=UPI0039C5E2D8